MAKNQKKGVGFIIIGTLVVLLAVALGIFATALLFATFFRSAHSGEVCAAAGSSAPTVVFILLIFAEVLMLTFYVSGKPEQTQKISTPMLGSKKAPGESLTLPKYMIIIMRVVCSVAIVATILVSANSYTVFDKEGIKNSSILTESEYKWSNVRSYNISCDSKNGFDMTLNMKDGKTYSLLTSDIATDEFEAEFEDIYGYLVYVDAQLKELQVPKNVKGLNSMETTFSNQYPEIWEKIKIITDFDELTKVE